MTTPTIDLTCNAFTKVYGEITVYGTWFNKDGTNWRPALVLTRTGDEHLEYCVPCVMSMDRIWVMDEKIGDEVKAGQIIGSFLAPLRMSMSKRNAYRLLSILRNHIGDAISIGVRPVLDSEVIADAKFINKTTGKTVETEITENA